jgi:hypothetical protein
MGAEGAPPTVGFLLDWLSQTTRWWGSAGGLYLILKLKSPIGLADTKGIFGTRQQRRGAADSDQSCQAVVDMSQYGSKQQRG